MSAVPQEMTAAVLHGHGDMKIEKVPVPTLEPGDVLIKLGAAMTCGTDFKTYRRGHPVLIPSYPSLFGHEMAGSIVALGDQVNSFQIGQRVVSANSGPCGQCFFCGRHEENLCDNMYFLNGAFAEYVRIPEAIVRTNLQVIPDHLPFREATLTEPTACVVHAAEHMRLKKDETVVLLGSGPMSLLFVQVAKDLGARVLVLGRSHDKLEVAKQMGADWVQDVRELDDVAAAVRQEANSGHGADLVIEAIGTPETWKESVTMVRKGGRVCLFGGCKRDTLFQTEAYRMHYEQIAVSGVFHYTPRHFKKALQILAGKKVNAAPLIVDEKRLAELDQVFYPEREGNPLKIAVIP